MAPQVPPGEPLRPMKGEPVAEKGGGGASSAPVERPLRVLHMAHIRWFNAEVQYALDLAEEMRRRGHAVSFLGATASPGVLRARAAGLATYEESGFNAKGPGALRALPAAGRLRSLLARRRYDALVVHRSEGLPLIALAGCSAGVPVVRVRGDMRPVRRDPLNRVLYRRLLAAVIASNRSTEASLRERLGRIPGLATIHGGVDPTQFSPDGDRCDVRNLLGFPRDCFLVGILGRLDPVKGQADFLEAAARVAVAVDEARFVVLVKDPTPAEKDLRRRIAERPELADRVGFLGRRADLPAVLRAFDLGVVASVASEANCRVGLEWMASAVPLVATRVGVLPDLVDPGRTGTLTRPGDPAELARAVAELAADRSRARRYGAAARARVLSRFTLGHCASAHEQLIRDIMAER